MEKNKDYKESFTTDQLMIAHDHYFTHYHETENKMEVHERYAKEIMGQKEQDAKWYAIWSVSEIEDCHAEEYREFFKWYYENYIKPPQLPHHIIIILM